MKNKDTKKVKTVDDKKTFLEKCNTEIKSAVVETRKLKADVEKSVANNKDGLSASYPMFKTLRTLRLKVMDQAKTDGANNICSFMETNFTPINQRKLIFDEINYPSEKDEQGKYKRDYIFENLFVRANKLSTIAEYDGKNGYENKNCGLTIKGTQFFVVSKEIYPDLPVMGKGSEITSVQNESNELIKLTTRGLEIIYARCRPVISRKSQAGKKKQTITNVLKEIKQFLNSEWLRRKSNVNYLDENYLNADINLLNQISEFSLRIVEQYNVDKLNINKDGDIKNIKVIKELVNINYQVKDDENKLISKAVQTK